MLSLRSSLEVPHRLRALVRARESSLIMLAAIVGALAGIVVALMGTAVDLMHQAFFGLDPGERLSGRFTLDPLVAFTVPFLGGIVFGPVLALIARWRPRREVDPIEANALRGGRMSLVGSVIVAAETVWSSGVGASVGLEAGYTQLASGLASRVGRAFRLRRGDLRILVGCGAAAGIAGAFGAPLGGAFYGFELVIGGYSTSSLAPVGIASLVGYFVAKGLAPVQLGVLTPQASAIAPHDLIGAGALGLGAALLGILVMRGVALCETAFTWMRLRPALRPALGGTVVGAFATVSPQVLSSGHGALHLASMVDLPLRTVSLIFVLKILASIVSLGSGFRGGLFFASLLIGALGGQLFSSALNFGWSPYYFDPNAYAVIGMSALSASVIGGPLTMTFIALETTGDLWLATAVLVAVIVAAQVTREAFGYSFATWRFHLRGETIRSAADVGWMRDLTVSRMMRPDVATADADLAVAAFREAFPLGSTHQVVAVDHEGRYVGLITVADAHAMELPGEKSVRDVTRHSADVLLPSMTIKEAVVAFDRSEAEALAVVNSFVEREVVGLLTEAYALRRYSAALELRRREVLGSE